MTNADIVLNEALKLMKEGKIKGTGKFAKLEDGTQIELPEAIHTYAVWKSLGYQVQKGQKAVAQFPVWKFRAGTKEAENEHGEKVTVDNNKMFMKLSSFFTIEQVQPIAK